MLEQRYQAWVMHRHLDSTPTIYLSSSASCTHGPFGRQRPSWSGLRWWWQSERAAEAPCPDSPMFFVRFWDPCQRTRVWGHTVSLHSCISEPFLCSILMLLIHNLVYLLWILLGPCIKVLIWQHTMRWDIQCWITYSAKSLGPNWEFKLTKNYSITC